MEIVPGLHQLKTPMPSPALPYVMPYALAGRDGVTLFDSGYGTPEATEAMTAGLAELGLEPRDVTRVIVSHAHPDHLGMLGWLKEQAPGCEVVMLDREWESLAARRPQGDGARGSEDWMRRSDDWLVQHGVARSEIDEARRDGAERMPWEMARRNGDGQRGGHPGGSRNPMGWTGMGMEGEPEVRLADGEVYEFDGWSFEAVWTPGHTPGHLCLYERNHRLMLTGDHVLPHITPNVSLHQDQEGTSPLADFRASLEKVAKYDTVLALPAHEFNFADLPGRARALLHHHDERLEEVRAAIGDGVATASDVSARVHWNTGPYEEFSVHTKRSALGETLSHLVLLLEQGRVRRVDDDDRVLWEQA